KPEPKPEPEPVAQVHPVVLLLKVADSKTQAAISANVSLEGAEGVPVSLTMVENGIYQATFRNQRPMQYQLNVRKEGYMYKSASIDVPAAGTQPNTLRRMLSLDPLQTGYRSVLRNIYFDYGKATLKRESFTELEKLKQMLQENPNISVEISGHTDSYGSKDFNKRLSENRAKAVVEYLIKAGIKRSQLTAKGYGEERPLASNDDDRDGREINRRVEFEILRGN